jgi:alpha-tubulin suppressor-like RCC1 family protein
MRHPRGIRAVVRAVVVAGSMVGVLAGAPPAGASSVGASSTDAGATATYEMGSGAKAPRLLRQVTGEIGIDAGNYGVMAINANHTVEGWGQPWAPRGFSQVPVLKDVVQLADGNDNYAALEAPPGGTPGVCQTDTSVWTVGLNLGGDLGIGDGKRDTYATPQRVTTLDGLGVVQVVAASGHMLALTCNGDVYVWGSNEGGVMALSKNSQDFYRPKLNTTLTRLAGGSSTGVELTTGSFSADLLVRGQAYGWGNNNLGQCGCGSTANEVVSPTPVIQHGVKFNSIDGGGDLTNNGHTLAVDAQGNAYCWGDNQQGQCGMGTTGIVTSPTKVPGLPAIDQALAGGQYSAFLDSSGSMWTCGDNAKGQVGNGSTSNQLTVVSVLKRMTMISAGAGHAVAAN